MPWRFNPFTGNLDETDIPAFNGEVTLGSAASPSIFFTGDPNTGIYSPGADQVALSTNGTGRLFVNASGNVGIGATSPDALLQLSLNNTTEPGTGTLPSGIGVSFGGNNGANAGLWFSSNFGASNQGYCGIAGARDSGFNTSLRFYTNSATSSYPYQERARIDSSGRLLVGTSTDSGGALLQVNGDRIRVATAKTPASATATGTAGEICWDADYIYVCVATNSWKRTAIAAW